MNWTILDSVELAKIYPKSTTRLHLFNGVNSHSDVENFLTTYHIPFFTCDKSFKIEKKMFFGSLVDFRNLYIVAGIIKSFGYNEIIYQPSLNNIISIGTISRRRKMNDKYVIPINLVLSNPFDTTTEEFLIKHNLKNFEVISSDEFIRDEQNEKTELDDQNYDDFDENINESRRDPYENFSWGGLRGEEAHTAYWNCD